MQKNPLEDLDFYNFIFQQQKTPPSLDINFYALISMLTLHKVFYIFFFFTIF